MAVVAGVLQSQNICGADSFQNFVAGFGMETLKLKNKLEQNPGAVLALNLIAGLAIPSVFNMLTSGGHFSIGHMHNPQQPGILSGGHYDTLQQQAVCPDTINLDQAGETLWSELSRILGKSPSDQQIADVLSINHIGNSQSIPANTDLIIPDSVCLHVKSEATQTIIAQNTPVGDAATSPLTIPGAATQSTEVPGSVKSSPNVILILGMAAMAVLGVSLLVSKIKSIQRGRGYTRPEAESKSAPEQMFTVVMDHETFKQYRFEPGDGYYWYNDVTEDGQTFWYLIDAKTNEVALVPMDYLEKNGVAQTVEVIERTDDWNEEEEVEAWEEETGTEDDGGAKEGIEGDQETDEDWLDEED